MRQAVIFALFSMVTLCGCLGGTGGYTCSDGRQVQGPEECGSRRVTQTTLDIDARLLQCEKGSVGEYRYACITNLAIDSSDLSLCDKLKNRTWVRYCYGKLNMSRLLGPEESTTLPASAPSTVQESSTTTTTTIPCGNGILDEGEECDIGGICPEADGVCSISPAAPKFAVCLYNTTCEWDTQIAVSERYDLGECSDCFGRRSPLGCECLKQQILNATIVPPKKTVGVKMNDTQFAESGHGAPTSTVGQQYHMECADGLCRKVDGKGSNSCSTHSACRHNECSGGKCILVRSPGTSQCKEDNQCS